MADPVAATVPTPAPDPAAKPVQAQTVPTPPPTVTATDAKPATLLGDIKPAETPKVEIKYNLKPVDKGILPATHSEKIVSFSKERGLSNEVAQAMLEAEDAHFKEYVDTAVKAEQAKVDGWKSNLQKNPKFAGEKLAEFNTAATDILNKYGSPGLIKLLQDSGFAYHEEVANFLHNVAKASAAPKVVAPGAPAAPPSNERDNSFDAVAQRMFGKTMAGKK